MASAGDELWLRAVGEDLEWSEFPFEGARRFVATGSTWSAEQAERNMVMAFEQGASAEFMSDNPYAENSLRWLAWRTGQDWAKRNGSSQAIAGMEGDNG